MKRPIQILLLVLLPASTVFAQMQFSLSTDVSVLRSFKETQKYWAVGQTVTGHFHVAPKDELFAWLVYYSDGKFTNRMIAEAKSPATNPQELAFVNNSRLSFEEISVGYKRYFKESFDSDNWNIYAYGGLGIMMGHIQNEQSTAIDTAQYSVPVLSGKANFKRMTLDLGTGLETPLGGYVFGFIEGRCFLPITDFPSPYLTVNDDAPLTASINLGIRILF